MLVYVQPIFAPDENQLERNLKSIISLQNYLEKYPYNIIFITGGWCAKQEYWLIIENLISKLTCQYHIHKFDQNYGKAYVVNNLYLEYVAKTNTRYFLSADSDMLFDINCSNMMSELESLANIIENKQNTCLGMLSLQQTEHNCHQIKTYDQLILNNHEIRIPNPMGNMAGGAILTSKNAWEKIKGYRLLNVYGGNDGWYLHDCAKNNFFIGLVNDIWMIHPKDNDIIYAHWKVDQVKNNLNQGNPREYNDLIKTIKNSEIFWHKK